MTFKRQCPCCFYLTLSRRGSFQICPVCFWEDDGQDDLDAEDIRGGPNGHLSLQEARANYLVSGACNDAMVPNVRPPLETEKSL